jgi:hypothetical protein
MKKLLNVLLVVITLSATNGSVKAQPLTIKEMKSMCMMQYGEVETYLLKKGFRYQSTISNKKDEGSKTFTKITKFASKDFKYSLVRNATKTFPQNYHGKILYDKPVFETTISLFFESPELLEQYKEYFNNNNYDLFMEYQDKHGDFRSSYTNLKEEEGVSLFRAGVVRKDEAENHQFGVEVTVGTGY